MSSGVDIVSWWDVCSKIKEGTKVFDVEKSGRHGPILLTNSCSAFSSTLMISLLFSICSCEKIMIDFYRAWPPGPRSYFSNFRSVVFSLKINSFSLSNINCETNLVVNK